MSALNRRALVGAAALAPLMAFSCAQPAKACADRAEWGRAVEALRKVEAKLARQQAKWSRLAARLDRLAPRPPSSFLGPKARNGYQPTFTVSLGDLHEWDEYPNAEVRGQARRIREAWQLRAAISKHLGEDVAADECDELGGQVIDQLSVCIEMPAPDQAALLWKLDRLFGTTSDRAVTDESESFCAEWANAIMADARRLLGGGDDQPVALAA